MYNIQIMENTDPNFGWGCYWKLRSHEKEVGELIQIIKDLGGDKELKKWLEVKEQREIEKENRRLKRRLNNL
eukprot:COSAG02_NODE_21334_length_792_cov_826.080808_1_plen_71_part_10